jgi:hypothetical protein
MNRIYQGRGSQVEIPNPGDKENPWQPLDPDPKLATKKWQALLWRHHEMFQDDVNYLLAAFATLVPPDCEDDIWRDYRDAIERSWIFRDCGNREADVARDGPETPRQPQSPRLRQP